MFWKKNYMKFPRLISDAECLKYYLDLKISYDFRKNHTNQDSVAEVLLKEAIYLPGKAVVKSRYTTARMLKKSVEQVKSIWNFFD